MLLFCFLLGFTNSQGALGSLVEWLTALLVVGGWSFMIFKVPSNLIHSMILLNRIPLGGTMAG